jgi:hypothetical protein
MGLRRKCSWDLTCSRFACCWQVAEIPLDAPDYPIPRFSKKLFSMLTEEVSHAPCMGQTNHIISFARARREVW